MRSRIVLAAGAAGLLAACATGPKFGAPGSVAQPVTAGALPSPEVADMTVTRDYLIAPFDQLAVQVHGVPDLTLENVSVGSDGMLSYPLIGDLPVTGLTAGEVEAQIANRLRGRYMRNPFVNVRVKETVTQVVTVDGAVNQPGRYPVVGEMTLIDAIASARGLNQQSRPSSVMILRTVGGQKMAALYNLTAIRRGVYEDPKIYPRDVVVVDDNRAQQYFRDAMTIFSTLSYPLITLLRP